MTLPSIPSTKGLPAGTAAAARRRRVRKAARRAGYAGLGLLGILLVVFFLLPVWISNEQGRTYILRELNRNLRAKVAIEDWSLGWFRGTELKNVTVTLPDGTRLLSCPRAQSELTLWGILWGRYDVGITRVDTAQLSITRYADGTNSLDSLFGDKGNWGAGKIFGTLRGSLQVGSAVVTINSAATGKSLTYTDVKAAVTIASPEAPFHAQISAVGAGGAAGERSLSLNATLPALATWPAPVWSMVSDIELSATGIPTALVCDYCGQDPRWEDSFGAVIERARFSNHATPPLETSLPTLEVKGADGAYVDAAMLLRAAGDDRGGTATATLSLPAAGAGAVDFHASAGLRISAPLVALLRRINPLLGAIRKGDGLVEMTLGEMNITAHNAENVQASGRLTFPPLELERRGIVADLLSAGAGGGGDKPEQAGSVAAEAEPLRARVSGGLISYDNFNLVCGRRQRVTFSGSVGLDGSLSLLATVPASGAVAEAGILGSSRTDIPVTGTAENPVVTLPR